MSVLNQQILARYDEKKKKYKPEELTEELQVVLLQEAVAEITYMHEMNERGKSNESIVDTENR